MIKNSRQDNLSIGNTTLEEIKNFLLRFDNFLITSHIEPDGDAIGSQLAMAAQIKSLGKNPYIVNHEPVPKRYRFLPEWETVQFDKGKNISFEAAIFLDVGNMERVGNVVNIKALKNVPILNIDHHISNIFFGEVNYVDSDVSSTCECLFDIFKALHLRIDEKIGMDLATGIITDTGRFSFKNTKGKTFSVCAELASAGVDFYSLSKLIYNKRSIESLSLLSQVLSTVKIIDNIAFIRLTQNMLKKTGANERDSEGFVNYALSLDNIRAAVFMREKPKGLIRVSLRAKSANIDVNKIASKFGGGGHPEAAGFRCKESFAQLEKKILKAFDEYEKS